MPDQTEAELKVASDVNVARVLATLRPLTDEDIDKLAMLLRGGDRIA